MKLTRLALSLALTSLLACSGPFHTLSHDEVLPSGKKIQVTQFLLAWGVEHDDRQPKDDCFALEYVSPDPNADAQAREQEAREVFELIRPTSEQWALDTATIARFPKLERKGPYDLYVFTRGPDRQWTLKHEARKVFAND